ncbi:MAG: tetratricopeptide repeat protein [Gemmatimonadota bacterium]|nr:MAG: tetratricopeptide repeat protein [Gemmatimonadota bacterium]
MMKKGAIVACVVALIVALAYGLRDKREVTTNSAEAYMKYRKGIELANKFYFEEALACFERATQLDTGFAMAFCRLGVSCRNYGRIEEAREALAKAVELAPNTTEKEQLIISFHNAHTNRDYTTAREMIEKLAQRYSKAIEPYEYRGNEYLRLRQYEKGIIEFERILKIDPNYAPAYNQLGYAYAYLSHYDKAIANMKKYVFLSPDQPNPHDSLGEIYLIMGRYDEAITEFNKARVLKPDFAFAIDHLGRAYQYKGMYRKAISYFEKGAATSTNQWIRNSSQIQIARTHYERGDYEQSLSLLEKIPADGPQLYILKWLMGLNYTELGVVHKAVEQREQLEHLILQEEQRDVHERYGELYTLRMKMYVGHLSAKIASANGTHDKAIEHFQNILAQPLWPREEVFFRTAFAEALFKSRDTDKAIAELEKVVAINPNYSHSRYLLGRIYDELGHIQKAVSEMEKFLLIMDGCDEGIPQVEETKQRFSEIKGTS